MKIAILVSQKYAGEYYIDDELLRNALRKEGMQADIVAWDNAKEVKKYHTGIIRSCWDYHNRKDEFLSHLEQYATDMKIFNSLPIIQWNCDKKYLSDLAGDVKIIETKTASNLEELSSIVENASGDVLILKPNISASGMNTHRVKSRNKHEIAAIAQTIFNANKKVLVQKYISSIEQTGERSLVVIDGECTYAYKKQPAKNNFLVHKHWGGSVAPSTITDEDTMVVNRILKIIDRKFNECPLYMRIDLLYEENEPLVLELELIEPGLNISEIPRSLELFIQGIKKRFSR